LLYILWGEDDLSIEENLQGIKDSLGDNPMLSTNTTILDGQKLTISELKSVGEALPFLAEKRLVIVQGLLDRFENNRAGTVKKGVMSPGNQENCQALATCIRGLPESTVLVLTDHIEVKSNSAKNNPLYNAISAKALVRVFPLLRGIKLAQWVQTRVTQHGGSISRQATNLLIEFIGSNLYIMNNEILKLVSYTDGRMIEEQDVRRIVSYAQEGDIFALVDAIMDRKVSEAEKILAHLLQNGMSPSHMLVLLSRQVQMLVQLKDLRNQKRPLNEVQRRLGIVHEFVWNKISSRAEKYTLDRLKEIYQNLLEVDLSIKTGRLEGELALDILVAGLCSR
jgi:DNA polymerase-3 subunit delta